MYSDGARLERWSRRHGCCSTLVGRPVLLVLANQSDAKLSGLGECANSSHEGFCGSYAV